MGKNLQTAIAANAVQGVTLISPRVCRKKKFISTDLVHNIVIICATFHTTKGTALYALAAQTQENVGG